MTPRRLLPHRNPGRREAVDEEIRHHLAEAADRLIDQGWDPDEARAEAERRFGAVERVRDEMLAHRDDDGRMTMETVRALAQDVRLTLRALRRRPVFTWTLVLTLAVGIGAAGAIFSMIDAVLLRPLPYDDPDRIVEVGVVLPDERGFVIPSLQRDQVEEWIAGADFLSEVAVHEQMSLVRTDGTEPENLAALAVGPTLDDVLGLTPALGRAFAADDARPGERVVMLSYPYWARTGRSPEIVGQTIRLDEEPWTVVGVLPRGFKYPVTSRADLWIPVADDYTVAGRAQSQLNVMGRIAPGLTLEAAQGRADALGEGLTAEQPHEIGWMTRLQTVGHWRGNPDTVRGLWTAFGAVVGMLLIAMVNGANLQLVRGEDRRGEVGVRMALGASRGRVLRHMLVESVVLSLLAGLAATGLAWLFVEGLRAIAPRELTFGMVHDFGIESRALLAVFAVALSSGLAVGLLPALRTARAGGAQDVAGRRLTDRSTQRLRSLLVVGEVALSVVLLVGAGLFMRSFAAIARVEIGMDSERIAAVGLSLPSSRYESAADRAAFTGQLTERLSALPGAVGVTFAQGLPPQGGGISFNLELEAEGGEARPIDDLVNFNTVPPGFISVLGTRLHEGRGLQAGDRESGGVVIDRDLARLIFDEDRVVGRRFRFDPEDDWSTVVGVVEELKLGGLDDPMGSAAILYPMDPNAPSAFLSFAVRTDGDPATLLPLMRQVVHDLDPTLPLRTLQTGEELVAEGLVRPRFLVLLIGVLAATSLLLAVVGLFGVVSYTVARGRREMGIRMALGASSARVRGGVLRWGLGVTVIGVALGLGAATLVDDLAASLLYGVAPGDPITTVGVAVTMVAAALLACWLPAARATRVDPAEVLRPE
ncbi:ABC transporter permease [Gemmatimonadota bacterium DH-20]|uniref:ABC transporter permease n=1 Tax=Gaopeijia maritima TaxID=3119007 RepID=A0ABU9EG62_9BACT